MSKSLCIYFSFALRNSVIGLTNCRHFLNQSGFKLKTNCDLLAHIFPRWTSFTSAQFSPSSDWLIVLFASVVIGRFWLHNAQLKTIISGLADSRLLKVSPIGDGFGLEPSSDTTIIIISTNRTPLCRLCPSENT